MKDGLRKQLGQKEVNWRYRRAGTSSTCVVLCQQKPGRAMAGKESLSCALTRAESPVRSVAAHTTAELAQAFPLASGFLRNQNKSHLAIWDYNSNRGSK